MDYRKIYEASLREDSLDDFDIDGSIAKKNKAALEDEGLQERIIDYRNEILTILEDKIVPILKNDYKLEYSSAEYPKANNYSCHWERNIFGGSDHPGSTFFAVFDIGSDYYGGVGNKIRRKDFEDFDSYYQANKEYIKDCANDLQEKINRIIESLPPKYKVSKLMGYGDIFLNSSFQKSAIQIKISIEIPEDI